MDLDDKLGGDSGLSLDLRAGYFLQLARPDTLDLLGVVDAGNPAADAGETSLLGQSTLLLMGEDDIQQNGLAAWLDGIRTDFAVIRSLDLYHQVLAARRQVRTQH